VYAGMLAGEAEGLCSRIFLFAHAVARSEFADLPVTLFLSSVCV